MPEYIWQCLETTPLYVEKHRLAKHTRVVHIEHHLAHAASAYYTSGSPRRESLIVTCNGWDGVHLFLEVRTGRYPTEKV